MIPKNKVWKITFYTGRADFSPKDHRDIIAPTRRLALLNFRAEHGFQTVVSIGVRRDSTIQKRLGGYQPTRGATDRPVFGVQYRLTGGSGVACIANGNTWAESEDKTKPVRNMCGPAVKPQIRRLLYREHMQSGHENENVADCPVCRERKLEDKG